MPWHFANHRYNRDNFVMTFTVVIQLQNMEADVEFVRWG
jgi:hypothetical protein